MSHRSQRLSQDPHTYQKHQNDNLCANKNIDVSPNPVDTVIFLVSMKHFLLNDQNMFRISSKNMLYFDIVKFRYSYK